MKRVLASNWISCYNQFEKILDKYWEEGGDQDAMSQKIDAEVRRLYEKHKGEHDWDVAFEHWKDDSDMDERELHISEPLRGRDYRGNNGARYIIKDNHGNQLSAPTEDEDRLWDRVLQMENRGQRGLSVVVYTGE